MREFLFGIAEITLGMSLLILLMLTLLKLIGGKFTAKCRYILWTLVMIRLAVPLSFGILPALIEVQVEPEPKPVQIQIPVVSYTPISQEPAVVPQQEQLQMPTPPVETPMFTEPVPEPLTWEEISAYIPHLYLTGAAVFLLWNLLSYGIYTGRIVRSSKPADPEAQRVYETVCRKKEVHRPPVLLMSPGLSSPAAFGLLRRRIVLPDIDLSENGLAGTLSHEVTHCKRGDLWIKAFCLLARSFHWFNPLVHLAAFRCEMEMELSCDESVLTGCSEETRAAYGEVMLDIIRRCRRNRGSLTTHFNPKKNAVKARFTNILYGSGKKRGLWLIAVCLVLCLIAGAIVACTTDVPEEETDPETTETPEEPLPEPSGSGEYPSMEAYVNERMAKETTAQYYSIGTDGSISNQPKTANVTDTKLTVLEKKGEVIGLSPDGVLECWRYKYLLKLDVPTEEVIPVGGQEVEDDWFDLEGQNGHTVVTLRHPDGTYTILMDEMTGDGLDFAGYRNSYEEAIYDWYVTEYDIDLPLYVEEWGNLITPPEGEHIGNTPVHRFDGDGWGIYIPIQAWYSSTDAMENQWLWRSSYNTGSMLTVDVFNHSLEDEYVTAELQGYTPTDRTNRIWELHKDDIHSYYYYYEKPDGGFWRVTIAWTDEGITEYPYIAIEPQVLKLMAEKFVVFGAGEKADNALTVTSPIYLCDDVYRSETTPTHGEGTITFPDGLNGYKLYTCEVLLCGDECDPHDVVWRNFFGYAGGYDLQEMELTRTGSYPAKLYLMEYPEDIVAQILSDMEKGGASEEEKLAYRNRRWYLYLLTVDADHYACIFLEPENMAARPENEQEILDAMVASVEINLILPNPEVELVSYPYTDRVFPVPEYWEEEQIAVLEYTSNTTPAFSFALYEWRAHTENDTGLVWILSAHTLEEFAETAEFWKNTHDIDVYTQIFSQANYLLGKDTEYAYVLTLPTDVQSLEKDPVSYQQYERLQISSQTVLGWFMEENGITPNPTCPASAVYAPAEETPEGIASTFLNRYLHQVYTYTETAFTEMMDPAYHTPIAYMQDKAQYLSYTRQARGEMAYDFDVEYYNTQTTNPAENFKACSIRASIRFRKEPYGEMVNLEERYIVTLRETETGWLVTDMMQENDRFDGMYKANGFDLNALLTEFNTSLAGDPDTIWQTFLDTVVAPYKENISSQEFLDLDGNGIEELLLFDLGNGICEIYTIEGGEVKCLSAGQQGSGHSLLTIYHDNPTMLAPPSLGAGEYVFFASRTPEDMSKTRYKNWFIPSPKTGGYVLYSTYGHTTSRTDQYFHFYSGEDAVLGKVLCVAELSRFELEAINSNPALGWECRHQGEKVTKSQYMDRLEECWKVLEETYGVTYTEEETNHHLDELRKTVDTSFELLADLLDMLKTEDPQAYITRAPNGDGENPVPAWGFYEDDNFPERLATEFTFEPLSGMEVQEENRKIILRSVTPGEWVIYGWVNSNYIELVTGGQSYFFRAIYKWPNDLKFGNILNDWFYQSEFNAIPYQSVISDEGQGFIAAAQTFVESYYNRHLLAFSGSEHAFTYVSCSVRDAENREGLIERGWIGQNTYTYYVTVIFVPENPHAGRQYYAGNTGLYTGNDPTVPANAYEFQRCGYITLEEDGWHGEVGGTGW